MHRAVPGREGGEVGPHRGLSTHATIGPHSTYTGQDSIVVGAASGLWLELRWNGLLAVLGWDGVDSVRVGAEGQGQNYGHNRAPQHIYWTRLHGIDC